MKQRICKTFGFCFFVCFQTDLTGGDGFERIIGGQSAYIYNFPHSAFLLIDNKFSCGSSIIRDKILLTAAHCLAERSKNTIVEARIGHENINYSAQKIRAKKWIIHENYVRLAKHDLGLIYLKKKIIFGHNVKKAVLDFNNPDPGKACYVAGWGATHAKGPIFVAPFKSLIQVIQPPDRCFKMYKYMDRTRICAAAGRNWQSPYNGDSGGALVYQNYRQVGLLIGGDLHKTDLVMYTAIWPYKEWLQNKIALLEKS